MSKPLHLPVNDGLAEIEQALSEMFTEAGDREQAMLRLIGAIERHGCDGYLVSRGLRQPSKPPVLILALDVAWLVPGPDWIWSKGGQVCWCRPDSKPQSSWYRRVLSRYFKAPAAASLLSLPSVFTRAEFVNLTRLAKLKSKGRHHNQKLRQRVRGYDVWTDTFDPRRSKSLTVQQWEKHFERYRRIIKEELAQACPDVALDSTVLAWVYISPGLPTKSKSPPHWAASVFMIFHTGATRRGGRGLPPHVNMLLANLLRSLQNSAPAALGNRREKQTLVQVVAHEFKNVTQEAAAASLEVKSRAALLANVPVAPKQTEVKVLRSDLVELAARAEMLNFGVQVTSAFSRAAYWLFSPKDLDTKVVRDPGAVHFRHALALTIRLVAASNPTWKLVGIPTIEGIVEHFRKTGLPEVRLDNLTQSRSISVMIFFALEAVRNMRNRQTPEEPLSISIGGAGNQVCLYQVSEGTMASATKTSNSLTALMGEVRLHCPWSLIEIDPIIRTTVGSKVARNRCRICKTTKFIVRHMLPL